jgi:hypothetical protein
MNLRTAFAGLGLKAQPSPDWGNDDFGVWAHPPAPRTGQLRPSSNRRVGDGKSHSRMGFVPNAVTQARK